MHIGAGHLNFHASHGSAASSVFAARRSEETRRKLAAASAELDAVSSSESAWMIDAWGGGGSGGRRSGQQRSQGEDEAANRQPLSLSDQTVGHSAVQAGFESSAQAVSQIYTPATRPLAVVGEVSSTASEVQRAPALEPVSFWA